MSDNSSHSPCSTIGLSHKGCCTRDNDVPNPCLSMSVSMSGVSPEGKTQEGMGFVDFSLERNPVHADFKGMVEHEDTCDYDIKKHHAF